MSLGWVRYGATVAAAAAPDPDLALLQRTIFASTNAGMNPTADSCVEVLTPIPDTVQRQALQPGNKHQGCAHHVSGRATRSRLGQSLPFCTLSGAKRIAEILVSCQAPPLCLRCCTGCYLRPTKGRVAAVHSVRTRTHQPDRVQTEAHGVASVSGPGLPKLAAPPEASAEGSAYRRQGSVKKPNMVARGSAGSAAHARRLFLIFHSSS